MPSVSGTRQRGASSGKSGPAVPAWTGTGPTASAAPRDTAAANGEPPPSLWSDVRPIPPTKELGDTRDESALVENARLAGATPLWDWIGDGATVFSY